MRRFIGDSAPEVREREPAGYKTGKGEANEKSDISKGR
jgi:hypothetical protein